MSVHIFRIGNDDKIVEHTTIRDDLSLMMQLGVVESTSPEYRTWFRAWKGLELKWFERKRDYKAYSFIHAPPIHNSS